MRPAQPPLTSQSDAAAPRPRREAARSRGSPRLFYGWWIVAVTFVGDFLTMGIGFYSFGLFFKPMSEGLGWSRGDLSLAFTIRSLVQVGLGPLVGRILDRHGPRFLMAGGAVAGGLALVLMSRVNGLLMFYVLFGGLWALAFGTMGSMVGTTTISKWFVRRRARAVAIAAMGISLGGVSLTQLTAFLIETYDWRTAWVVLGVLIWVLVIPLSLFFMRRTPEDFGLRPDGDPAPAGAGGGDDGRPAPAGVGGSAAQPGRRRLPVPHLAYRILAPDRTWTVKEAAHTRTLWIILAASNLSGLSMSTLMLHQVPYLQDQGLTSVQAAGAVTAFAVGSLTAKILWGAAAEFFPLRILSCLNFLGASGSIAFLIVVDSPGRALTSGFTAGVTMGAMPVIQSLLWPEYFGRQSLGTIRGSFMLVSALSSGFGPYLAGWLFDTTGTYSILLVVLVGATAAAGLLMLFARQPQPPKESGAPASPARLLASSG